jgi:hypothetical protein
LTYLRHGHRDRPAGVYGGVVEGSLVADHHDEAGYRVADDGDYGVTEAVGGAGPERLGRADLDQRFGHVAHVSIAPPCSQISAIAAASSAHAGRRFIASIDRA